MELWKKLKIGTGVFICKFDRNSSETVESYTFWLSDFKKLWNESINSKDNLLQRLIDNNPTLVTTDDTSNQLVSALNAVGSTTQVTTDIKPDDEEFQLKLKLSLSEGISSQFHWLLKKCEPQLFFEQITKSLLHQIGELQKDQKQLFDIVKKKENEVIQHRLESGGSLKRTRLITEAFNEGEFTTKPQMFDCEIDDFQSVIGPLSKIRKENEEKRISPKKPTNGGGQNRMRLKPQKLIIPGLVEYNNESDDDKDEPVPLKADDPIKIEEPVEVEVFQIPPDPPKRSPKKRFRQSLAGKL